MLTICQDNLKKTVTAFQNEGTKVIRAIFYLHLFAPLTVSSSTENNILTARETTIDKKVK